MYDWPCHLEKLRGNKERFQIASLSEVRTHPQLKEIMIPPVTRALTEGDGYDHRIGESIARLDILEPDY